MFIRHRKAENSPFYHAEFSGKCSIQCHVAYFFLFRRGVSFKIFSSTCLEIFASIGANFVRDCAKPGSKQRQIQDGDVKPDELQLIITALKRHENIRNCNFKPINEMNTS